MIRELKIKQLCLSFVLGNNECEKLQEIEAFFDITLRFSDNIACQSDNLADTVCYSNLIKFLVSAFEGKDFNLIESACMFAYNQIDNYLGKNTHLLKRVELFKPAFARKNLEGAAFVCSDW